MVVFLPRNCSKFPCPLPLYYPSCCSDIRPWQKQLEKVFVLAQSPRVESIVARKSLLATLQPQSGGKSDKCLCSAGFLLFKKSRTQTYGLVSEFTAINLIYIIPHRHAQKLIFKVIPDPIKSTTSTITARNLFFTNDSNYPCSPNWINVTVWKCHFSRSYRDSPTHWHPFREPRTMLFLLIPQ